MKKITSFLSLLCLICMSAAAQITSNPAQNKAYTVATVSRGYWKAVGTTITKGETADEASRFAFIDYQSSTYMYEIAEKKFVCKISNKGALSNDDFFALCPIRFNLNTTHHSDTHPANLANANANEFFNLDGGGTLWINAWTTADDGNCLAIVEADDFSESARQEAISILKALDAEVAKDFIATIDESTFGYVGSITQEDYEVLKNLTSYTEAKNFYESKVITPAPNKYYIIESAFPGFTDGQARVMTTSNDKLTWEVLNKTNVNAIWKITPSTTTAGKYNIQAVNSGKYAGTTSWGVQFPLSDTPADYTIANTTNGKNAAAVYLRTTSGANDVTIAMNYGAQPNNDNTYGDIHTYNTIEEKAYANSWLIHEANEVEVAMNVVEGESWSTLYLPFGVELEGDVEAYIAENMGGDIEPTVFMQKVDAVPANTGVVLKGTAANYTFRIADVQPLQATNLLQGTNVEKRTLLMYEDEDEGWSMMGAAWVLGCNDGKVGFYWPTQEIVEADENIGGMNASYATLKANKAYLDPYSMGGFSEATVLSMSFGKGNETTGIQSVTPAENSQNNVYYDLSGRRVLTPAKGIYVKNGKKIYVK